MEKIMESAPAAGLEKIHSGAVQMRRKELNDGMGDDAVSGIPLWLDASL
jgi:hypothetical protein